MCFQNYFKSHKKETLLVNDRQRCAASHGEAYCRSFAVYKECPCSSEKAIPADDTKYEAEQHEANAEGRTVYGAQRTAVRGIPVVLEWENEGCKKGDQQGLTEITDLPKQTDSTCDAQNTRNGERETKLQKKAIEKFPSQVK
tara:strand:- start:64 stop:489 length:426 start_codon:yes stop_codon:yes gene_type:complete